MDVHFAFSPLLGASMKWNKVNKKEEKENQLNFRFIKNGSALPLCATVQGASHNPP
jgi:hypothetical protein